MSSRLILFLSGLLLLVAIGCEADQGNPAGGGNATPNSPVTQQANAPHQGVPLGGPPAAGTPNSPRAQPAVVAPVGEFPIRLSAGTSLPQTAPEGTLMSFSVDFQANGYQPQPGVRWVLVIQRGDGKRIEQPVQASERRGSTDLRLLWHDPSSRYSNFLDSAEWTSSGTASPFVMNG